ALREDARLIRGEVARCRDIVQQMSARSGASLGEAPERVALGTIAAEVRAKVGDERAARLDAVVPEAEAILFTPSRGLVQALASLVKNAFEASRADGRVALRAEL